MIENWPILNPKRWCYLSAALNMPANLENSEVALEKEMATHSSLLAWKIPGREEPGGLQSTMGRQRVAHDWQTEHRSGHRTGKGQLPFQSPKGNAKESSNYHTTALISHGSKVILKLLQARLQSSTWTETFQMYKLGLEKAEAPEIKLPTPTGS